MQREVQKCRINVACADVCSLSMGFMHHDSNNTARPSLPDSCLHLCEVRNNIWKDVKKQFLFINTYKNNCLI